MIRRYLAATAVGVMVGGFTLLVLLIGYVIGKLYLAGHMIEPSWYDTAAGAFVFGGALAAFGLAFWTTWRGQRRSRSSTGPIP